jgi:hypothetical protein
MKCFSSFMIGKNMTRLSKPPFFYPSPLIFTQNVVFILLSLFENYANHFDELFSAEPDLCSVFINFFASKNTKILEYILNKRILPRSSVIHYLNHLVLDETHQKNLHKVCCFFSISE